MIQFAEAVEAALSGIVGPADVSPQTLTLPTDINTSVNIPNLTFSTTIVRGAFIRYTVYRTTSTATAAEAGTLTMVYNPSNPTGMKWDVSRVFAGDGQIQFYVTDTGQVQFTTTALTPTGGINPQIVITYQASASLQ